MRHIVLAGTVITAPGEKITDGGILIDDDQISAVGTRQDLLASSDGAIHDYPDGTLLPGLINCHVHLAFGADVDVLETLDTISDDQLLDDMRQRALTLLRCGVTTARDCADRNGLAARLRDEFATTTLGPRILSATAPLTPPGGHCAFLGGEVDGVDGIASRIEANIALGADFIKIMVSGGGLTPGGAAMHESQFDTEFVAAVVAEAHSRGLPVAAHAHNPASIAAATTAGVDTIEHCLWMTENRGFEPDTEVTREIAERGIAVCPADCGDWRRFADRMGEEKAKLYYGRAVWMAELGVRIIAGTDAGVFPFDEFPDVLRRFHTDWGFTPAQVLEMATTQAARALGLEGRAGVLAPGAFADCVLVDGDPLEDLSALRAIDLVMARGRPLVPDSQDRDRPVYTGTGAVG